MSFNPSKCFSMRVTHKRKLVITKYKMDLHTLEEVCNMAKLLTDQHSGERGVYDCIVVGGGAIGLGTALHLVRQGYRTLLLEQFSFPHTRGSSAGPSRMYRNAYIEEHHAKMVQEIWQMWEELEQETKTTLHKRTGLLVINNENVAAFHQLRDNLVRHRLPFQDLTTEQLVRRFPLMSYRGHYNILLDTEAGFLIANKCLRTMLVWRVNVCFFKEKQPGSYLNYPAMFDETKDGFIYCFPSRDYPGYMKFGYHLQWDEVDPDDRDRPGQAGGNKLMVDIEAMKAYVQEHFPGLEPEPSIVENCMYTCTPEEEIHPVYHNIAIGCGFSGKGFKMALLMGKILGDLAMGKPSTYDLSPISMKRFLHQKAKL
ncbi:peroxisomal sarcosine oxidase-like isoform X4 [Acanthaster planci]|uniref:Peroxisomal sarcosine oxidase-like isoform X4 n=1 Tax=Acanthaster planci TaxID=133434 RepID=A0A8B7Y038_ACAPL|nr:peroxisomal sarcosine oxidase-like isoform X4 [Acanthaster planci]